ncbi:hypothetical protein [Hydrogenophaga sp. RWCD_12]|uniref:hypothetical protein n=1 Tax=Hydrogenophaga sp. RWCD_12 TaxID=3391190 RepID=UPI00398518AD
MTQDLRDRLGALQQALAGLRSGALSPHAFSAAARGETALLAALPPRYAEVLNGLLDRLESSALFAEESCSFSQSDLADSVQLWIDKAGAVLAAR